MPSLPSSSQKMTFNPLIENEETPFNDDRFENNYFSAQGNLC